ncbi:MAG: hypothetical protein HF314_15480 [Ignavibacteria bacterium]|jgi:hypothetical protein|nr:hypothetical protein [Ignavibacteria bacterium]MCU7504481.1 hypothetical protein [Ignavibacteria bacterium]MCU7517940.1 hypothetical protein [Ignavibacteria bacterium]
MLKLPTYLRVFKKQTFSLLIALIVLSELLYAALYLRLSYPIVVYTSVAVLNSLIFIVICFVLLKNESSTRLAYTLIAVGILFRLTALFYPPTASDDINRYIWDGKVQSSGINPYRFAPADSSLKALHSENLPSKVNFPRMKSIYPPVAQVIFFTSYELFGESYLGYKLFLFIFEIATILLILYLLRLLGRPESFVGLYALCPLPVMQFMIDGHVDGLGIPLLILSIILFFKRKKFWFFLVLGLSISTKLISGMILPFTANELERRFFKKILAGVIVLLFFALTYLPYTFGGVFPFEALMTFTTNWTFNGSAFQVFFDILGDNQKARLVSAALFIVAGLYIFFRYKGTMEKMYMIFFAFFLLSPTVHPWYLTWLAALLPLSFRWSGVLFVALVSLANYVVIGYKLEGTWQMPVFILLAEYMPVYVMLLWEKLRGTRFTSKWHFHEAH